MNTNGHRRIPRDTEGHRKTPKDPEVYRRTSKDTEGCRRMPKDTATEFEHAGRKPGLQSIVALSVPCQTRSHTPLAPKTGPRRAQEGSKSGFNFFFSALGGAEGEKKGSKRGFRRERLSQDVDGDTIMSKRGASFPKKRPKCTQGCPKAPTRPSELWVLPWRNVYF